MIVHYLPCCAMLLFLYHFFFHAAAVVVIYLFICFVSSLHCVFVFAIAGQISSRIHLSCSNVLTIIMF